MGFISGMEGWFNIGNLLVSYTILIDLREKNPYPFLHNAGKALNKIQCLFFIKTLKKIGIEWHFINMIQYIDLSPKAKILLNEETR